VRNRVKNRKDDKRHFANATNRHEQDAIFATNTPVLRTTRANLGERPAATQPNGEIKNKNRCLALLIANREQSKAGKQRNRK